ncbi:MAG: dihydropteroate synthase [Dehalococcoidales bacterium]|nr:dihydropteroate synthase [Dehalococcoidales bacterium]MDD5605105.1 dihydropteroate synthase [Dehalococcoidales bacterium]MDX9985890.1 dihydropteroate synthase [Dehalococcoidales bacterium]
MNISKDRHKPFGNRDLIPSMCIGGIDFHWGERTYVMGIINVSPDSFSGDGVCGVKAAVEQAKRFVAEGADILDIGGESTRPGSEPVSEEQEIARVIPVVEAIHAEMNVPLSVDTYKTGVAERALEAGAHIINDIWGLKRGDEMAQIAAKMGAPLILMSNQRDEASVSIIPAVLADLELAIEKALSSGIASNKIIVDPGIGFGKTVEQNLEIIYRLGEIRRLGRPVLLGTSRKSVIGRILKVAENDRLEGTAATIAIGIAAGADIVRVHDVKAMKRVASMTDAIVRRN